MSVMDPEEARLRRYFAFLSNRIFHQASILALNYSPIMSLYKTFWLIVKKKEKHLLNLSWLVELFNDCFYFYSCWSAHMMANDWGCQWDNINVMQYWYTMLTSDILINQSIISKRADQWRYKRSIWAERNTKLHLSFNSAIQSWCSTSCVR